MTKPRIDKLAPDKRRGIAIVLFSISASLLLLAILPSTAPIEFIRLLAVGWTTYLQRVTPQISFNREIAFDAALALALATFGLHRILRFWQQRQSNETSAENDAALKPWKFRWTLKIIAMVLLMFAT